MSLSYAVVIFDENDNQVAIMKNATAPNYNRSKNAADQVDFEVPRTDNKIDFLRIGRRFEIIRAGTSTKPEVLEVSGFISERGFDGEMFKVSGFTEESLLERFLTPDVFGYPLYSENETIDSFFSQFSRSYITQRVKQNWSDYISSEVNVDYSSEPDIVILDDDTVNFGDPPATGSITFIFTKGADDDWDRIRWVSDYDEEQGLTTKVSYSFDGVNFTTPVAGSLTDIVGLVIPNDPSDDLYVKFDFSTSTDNVSPALYAVEVITRGVINGVNSVDFNDVNFPPSGVATPNLDANKKNFLQVLIDVCSTIGWEFKLTRGVLTFRRRFGEDRRDDYVLVQR